MTTFFLLAFTFPSGFSRRKKTSRYLTSLEKLFYKADNAYVRAKAKEFDVWFRKRRARSKAAQTVNECPRALTADASGTRVENTRHSLSGDRRETPPPSTVERPSCQPASGTDKEGRGQRKAAAGSAPEVKVRIQFPKDSKSG